MKITFALILLTLFCQIALTQDNCFNVINIPKLPKEWTDEDIKKRDSLFFETTIKNCKAPNFKANTIEGKLIELEKLHGKIVVLNFWFKECEPCITEMPELNKVIDEYTDKNIVFISLCRNDKSELDEAFFDKHPFGVATFVETENLRHI